MKVIFTSQRLLVPSEKGHLTDLINQFGTNMSVTLISLICYNWLWQKSLFDEWIFLKVCLFVRLGSFWDIKLAKGMFHLASTTILLTLKTSVPFLLAPSLVSSCVHGMACFLPVRFKNSQKKPGEMGLIAWLALL